MSVDVVMPPMGESVSSGMIATWLKKPGDLVAKDEPIVSINTDKADVDVPAPVSGRLGKIRFEPGAEVRVGEVLVDIEPSEAGTAAPAPQPSTPAPAAKPEPPPPAPPVAAKPAAAAPVLTPAAAFHAEKNGLETGQIQGSGPGGRILKSDVLEALAREPSPSPTPTIAPPAPSAPSADRQETMRR